MKFKLSLKIPFILIIVFFFLLLGRIETKAADAPPMIPSGPMGPIESGPVMTGEGIKPTELKPTPAPAAPAEGTCEAVKKKLEEDKKKKATTEGKMSAEKIEKLKGDIIFLSTSIPGLERCCNKSDPKECEDKDYKYYIADLGQYIALLYNFALGFAAILATVMLTFGGFLWLSAAGNPTRISKAKEYITSAITGLILTFGAYTILALINPDLVALKMPGIKQLDYIGESIDKAKELKGLVNSCKNLNPEKATTPLDPTVVKVAEKEGLDPVLLAAIFKQENLSSSTPHRGLCGEVGVTQLMPTTLNDLGYNCCSGVAPTSEKGIPESYKTSCKNTLTTVTVGKGSGAYAFPCNKKLCSHCAQASLECVNAFHNPSTGKELSMSYSAKLIKQILSKTGGDIALTFAGYNGGTGYVSDQAKTYAISASDHYKTLCVGAGGTL